MADGADAGAGAGTTQTGSDAGGEAGKGQQGQGGTGGGTQTGGAQAAGGAAGGQSSKSFSQDDVDRIVSDRLAWERKSFADYDDLKTKAAEFDKLTEAQKSDLQKAQDKAAESERKALQLESDLAESRLRSEVISTAAGKGIVDPVDAFKLLDRSKIEFDKAGDPTNVGVLLDELVKAKPYLSGRPGNGSGEGGPRGGTTQQGLTKNEWFMGRATGRAPQ